MCDIISEENVICVASPKGRGTQLNEGFKRSQGEILLFLHADTIISPGAFYILEDWFQKENIQVGKFSLKFDQNHWLLSLYAALSKFDSFWTSFGDQGIIVRRSFFEGIGGFPEWPLLEDVQFFQKSRKETKIHTLPINATTSAEKFARNGFLKQQIFNGVILFKYLLGYSVHDLSLQYEKR